MRHKFIYRMLVKYGHSPSTACELILDAQRGDKYALQWIGIIRKSRL